jgi:hypothetical protein
MLAFNIWVPRTIMAVAVTAKGTTQDSNSPSHVRRYMWSGTCRTTEETPSEYLTQSS